MRRLLPLLALTLAAPALGQATDFASLLAGKDAPASMQMKDLNADWRRVVIAAPDSGGGGLGDMMKGIMQAAMMSEMGKGKGGQMDPGAAMGMAMMGGMFGGDSKGPVYYTKGQTVTVAGETFLVAYRTETAEPNLMQMMMESGSSGKEPDLAKLAADAKLKPESALVLALVNVKSIGTMSGIRAFNLEKEIAESGHGGLLDMLLIGSQTHTEAPAPVATTTPVPAGSPAKPAAPAKRPRK